eukprot:TRINITY_DN60793_c0_g1_i1.p2 TRINITY_DN60793_c0_g1~~TRINITY_DN60793_c0_g1_i1.p2  ORF type:complete len:222 (+),score=62.05 TRINITY_DN60793_c0_g1_i1:76-741(+)
MPRRFLKTAPFRAMKRFLKGIERFYGAAPLTAAFTVGCAQAAMGDAVTQVQWEQCEQMDWWRVAKFSFFGGAYTGALQQIIYNVVYTRIFGSSTALAVAMRKLALEQFVHVPCFYFPAFYIYKCVVSGGTVADGVAVYKDEAWVALSACWLVWTPVQIATFTVIPVNLRIPWINTFTFIWNMWLSFFTPMNDDWKDEHPHDLDEPHGATQRYAGAQVAVGA